MKPDAEASLELGAPFDLARTLRRTALWGSDPTQRLGPREAALAFHGKTGAVTVHYQLDGPQGAGSVLVRAFGPGAHEAVQRAPGHLGQVDPSAAYEHPHPVVGPLLRRARGVRFGRSDRVFDRLVAVVLGQKVASDQAARSFQGLVRRYGEAAPGPYDLLLPPTAARLAALHYTDLHTLNVEGRRAEVLLSLARRAARLETLAELDPREAEARLLTVPGIGAWTAAHTVSAALGAPDAVPTGDWHFPNHVAYALTGAARGTDEELLGHLEPFRPYRGRALLAVLLGAPSAPRFGPRMPLRDFRRQ